MYLPGDPTRGDRPGVLINVLHPLSKQRFTAAHELAHHRRDREVVLDVETEWIARGSELPTDRERIAEAFAAWFLMPRRLVSATLQQLGLRTEDLDAGSVYALSLELGTSYAATVRHLADLRLIAAARRDALLHVAPQTIKAGLEALQAVRDSRRDVWLLRARDPERRIAVQEGDAVVVEVPEAPSSGYIWQVGPASDGLTLIRDEYRAPVGEGSLGGGGVHRFLFRVETPGRREVRLEMRRPWQRGASPADVRRVEIAAAAKPAPGMVHPRMLLPASA
jgi:predicted secreted protein